MEVQSSQHSSLTSNSSSLTKKQLDAHWMAFTGNRDFKRAPRIIQSANGRYYTDDKGREIFDGLSGLWTCGLGHCHPRITEAISEQAAMLDYSPAFQFGHSKAFELAERIASLMPQDLNRVFFTGSGSESVDTALKIARAYWKKRGKASKTKLIGRAKGYHGVNYGGISVGGIGANRSLYGEGLASDHLSHTLLEENRFSKGLPATGAALANELEEKVLLHGADNIAAVIVEPIAGSAGVLPPPKGYLSRLRDLCTKHDILLIFDEVITGFGRMGANSAAELFGVKPDLMTIAKQLTNGAIPMGAVVASQSIYDTFMETGGSEYLLELPHGYTYSAHPIACAAALATLDVIEQEGVISQVRDLSPLFEQKVHSLHPHDSVLDIRNFGLAAGLTFLAKEGQPLLRPYQIAMSCWQKGFYVRYGGDTIQLGVPFQTTEKELDTLINALGEAIEETKD
ncbi:aspartate aminotransferase family protein [Vibrio penaeicida]|uniref:Beta alanine--pyruvate aminotransferase n=1 Tax=Vibrio penaeicida TaxID=104609 RepID=A0AAV5NQF2_9VIBR|nr:aspartate aminotransferase family protein [Vibrio penaeicida]RTZ23943.1 aspartate aminotransferase family protein [Vibrio penaeicida]RTZ24783.1 aspartate aminotransferase family protein [Vibrio penaeicida]GLQ72846.1 beta alanine--pyruvate aminotransferase [Vibrio penaeicida]